MVALTCSRTLHFSKLGMTPLVLPSDPATQSRSDKINMDTLSSLGSRMRQLFLEPEETDLDREAIGAYVANFRLPA
jgi:hypothetical protein